MKITKLHLLLFVVIVLIGSFYVVQVQQEAVRRHEQQLMAAAAEAERQRAEVEERLRRFEAERAEKMQQVAVQVVAVAGEYWQMSEKSGRDVAQGQATLHQAKEVLALGKSEEAIELARRAIDELKRAPIKDVYWVVRRGDCLWRIAKMPRHYGKGAAWPRIWRANKKKIRDFDLIYPRQKLLIPGAVRTAEDRA